jgi:hypothetical protein
MIQMWLRRVTLCRLGWCFGHVDRDEKDEQRRLCFRCGTCGKASLHIDRKDEARAVASAFATRIAAR